MLKNLKLSHLARSTFLLAFFFSIDKVFSFVRAMMVNRLFGLSYELDAFNAANNIPDLLSALISGGALGVAMIPVLAELIEKGDQKGSWAVFTRILNLAFIVTGVVAFIIAIFAPWLVETFIAKGFAAEQKALTTSLMRLDLIAIMIFSISGLVMAGLQANQHFLLPALAPTMYNLGQIFGAGYLAPEGEAFMGLADFSGKGMGVYGVVYGVILGAALHLLIQLPGLLKYGFRWAPRIELRTAPVQKVLRLLGPRILTMFFIQMFFIIRDYVASFMDEGAITALNNGWFIMQVPETLMGTTIAIALLPTISEIFARGEKNEFRETVNGALRVILALTIPLALLMIAGISPLIKVAFGYTVEETARVALATRIYLLGLTGHAMLEISARSFYAQQDAKTPLLAAFLNAVGYIGIVFLLSNWLGFPGVALANILAFTLEALLLFWWLDRRFPGILKVRSTLLRAALPAIPLAAISYWLVEVHFASSGDLGRAAIAAGLIAIGMLLTAPFIWQELRLMLRLGGERITPQI
ncbi:MAG: murein biosynthesis integral membrane protein MurJ [Anaerolineales bacterium]|nr:murein biosynthesis integral membrane protein MurJ [Anaerolineales bacterium]